MVVQDTGVAGHLPSGDGLFLVRDVEEAAGAVEQIEGDYARHSAAAREIAREFLTPERVLPPLLEAVGA